MKDLSLALFAFLLFFDLGAAAQPRLQTQLRPTAKPSTVQALPVSGFVRDERGLPLAEVAITARQGSGRSIQTQSDQDGAFQLAGLHGGPVMLRFEREGYLDLDRSDFFIPGAPVKLSALSAAVTPLHEAIVLTPSQPISFTAIDELGVGIPAARIYALDFDAPHGTGASEGRLLGVADQDGRLTTLRLALGPYSILLDGGPTHPMTRFEGVHEGLGEGLGEGNFELTAPTGVPLKGRVYSSNPNRKFAVWALPVDEIPPLGSAWTAQSRQGFQRVLVDDIGRFRFEG
ncbi:MAG: carboxypeptidase-like regulatory domain-containing protein, partial [Planctomycetota bacterium]